MLYALLVVAALCALTLLAGWVWYPRRMAERGRSASPRPAPPLAHQPPISVILATREGDDAIEQRIENLRALDYASEQLEIVVALDYSRRDAAASVAQRLAGRAIVAAATERGKSSALNAGVASASHDLLLFVDTAQSFAPDVVTRLAQALQDPEWGAVTATLAPTSGDALMDSYWRRELAVRVGQTARHSVICVTGCAYLMRRQYWRPMPASLICDDLWSTYSVVTSGARVGIVTDASVVDPRRFTREQEYGRRLRTMTGMLQFVRWFPDVLRPRRNPMFADFLLHKLVRPATPVLLIVFGLSVLGAIALVAPRVAAVLTVAAAVLSLAPLLLASTAPEPIRRRAQTLLFTQRLLLMPLRAILQAVRSDWDVWKPHDAHTGNRLPHPGAKS